MEALLGVPVVGASARGNRGVGELLRRARDCPAPRRAPDIEYPTPIARAVDAVAAHMSAGAWNQRYIALRLLEGDMTFAARVRAQSGLPEAALRQARLERERLRQAGYDEDTWNDALVAAIYRRADAIAAQVVKDCLLYTSGRDTPDIRAYDALAHSNWAVETGERPITPCSCKVRMARPRPNFRPAFATARFISMPSRCV